MTQPSAPGQPGVAAPASVATLDAALATLAQQKVTWANLPPETLPPLLDEVLHDLAAVADEWVGACCAAKGLAPVTFGAGEEWVNVSLMLRYVRLLRDAVADIAREGRPRLPMALRTRPDGRVVAPILPASRLDAVLYPLSRAEVWMQPGQSAADVREGQAWAYRRPPGGGAIGLVLGAGNLGSLVTGDVLHNLFVERRVVLLKMNPVNTYLRPLIERSFRALIRRGVLAVVEGGATEGRYLAHHALVDTVHITGSDRTYEALVFGSGAEGAQRKAAGTPLLTKPVAAELGNISPVIVVPGPWSHSDVQAQGARLATWLAINAGFTCVTPRVIITQQGWAQRQALQEAVIAALRRAPTRRAYYPGAGERHAAFLRTHPEAIQVGAPAPGQLPWTVIPDLDPQRSDEICLRSEAFCSLFAETALAAAEPAEFLGQAVQFANERLWGTLAATILVHPASLRDPRVAAALERAVGDLRYGIVTINQFVGMCLGLGNAPWGSFPGQQPDDIQSGTGFVNNPLMLAAPEKAVMYGPFRLPFDPLVLDFPRLPQLGRQLATIQHKPGWGKVPGIVRTLVS
jgi:hypothetical protein